MIRNFEYLLVFTSAPSVLPEQNDRYWIQPWKVNEIKAHKKKDHCHLFLLIVFFFSPSIIFSPEVFLIISSIFTKK